MFESEYNYISSSGVTKFKYKLRFKEEMAEFYTAGFGINLLCSDSNWVMGPLVEFAMMFATGFLPSRYLPVVGSTVPTYMTDMNTYWIETIMRI